MHPQTSSGPCGRAGIKQITECARVGEEEEDVDSETNPFVARCWVAIGSAKSKLTGIDKARKEKEKEEQEEKESNNEQTPDKNESSVARALFQTATWLQLCYFSSVG